MLPRPLCHELDDFVGYASGMLSITDEKLCQIKHTIIDWQSTDQCSKHQLHSLLGQLLYVHKCVRPARVFLNRMLDLLCQNYDASSIKLTHAF